MEYGGNKVVYNIRKLIVGITSVLFVIVAIIYFEFINPLVDITVKVVNNKQELTTEQKLEDFNYMYNILKDNYPFFQVKKSIYGYDWLSHKEEFEEWIRSTSSNEEFYDIIERILYLLQNKHTGIVPYAYMDYYKEGYSKVIYKEGYSPWYQVLGQKQVPLCRREIYEGRFIIPVKVGYFGGQYIVVDSRVDGIPRGSVVKHINSMVPDEYVKTLMDKDYLDYDFKRGKIVKYWLPILSPGGERAKLTVETPGGSTVEEEINPTYYVKTLFSSEIEQENVTTDILVPGKIVYLGVKSFSYHLIDRDRDRIYSFLKEVKDYPYLIIDIRGNGGGSALYWENNIVDPLINKKLCAKYYYAFNDGEYIKPFLKSKLGLKYLLKRPAKDLPLHEKYPSKLKGDLGYFITREITLSPKNPVGFGGKIYLLVDERVYSSAEAFAAFAKATGWATLVGTNTGGDGIGFDPVLFILPNSKLVISFSAVMGINSDGTINEEVRTAPDIYVEWSHKDYIKYLRSGNRYDTILNYVLENLCK